MLPEEWTGGEGAGNKDVRDVGGLHQEGEDKDDKWGQIYCAEIGEKVIACGGRKATLGPPSIFK